VGGGGGLQFRGEDGGSLFIQNVSKLVWDYMHPWWLYHLVSCPSSLPVVIIMSWISCTENFFVLFKCNRHWKFIQKSHHFHAGHLPCLKLHSFLVLHVIIWFGGQVYCHSPEANCPLCVVYYTLHTFRVQWGHRYGDGGSHCMLKIGSGNIVMVICYYIIYVTT
jgi:hypothetical protein